MKRTPAASFDQLIGTGDQRSGQFEAKGLLLAVEDAIDITTPADGMFSLVTSDAYATIGPMSSFGGSLGSPIRFN
jgi:hypothetical protein